MDDFSDQILDYLNGNLDATTKQQFEAAMASNANLASDVRLYKDLYQVHGWMGEEEIKSDIQQVTSTLEDSSFFDKIATEIEKENNSSSLDVAIRKRIPTRSITIGDLLRIAAVLLLFFTLGIGWANKYYSNQQLAHRSFTSTVVETTTRNNTSNKNHPLSEGLIALNNKNYKKAINYFEEIPISEATYAEARLHLAIAQFRNEDYLLAQANARLVLDKSEQFKMKAKWLLTTALLAANNNSTEFTDLLEELVNDTSHPFYQKSAKDLKADLESFARKLVFEK